MALIASGGPRLFLSEENSLKGGVQGWTADGNDVYTRCISCKNIMRVRDVRPEFRDGRGTCVNCVWCGACAVYIFAGWKSDDPRIRTTGTYRVCAVDPPAENLIQLSPEGYPCGGTLIYVIAHPAAGNKCYCLTCLKESTWQRS